METTIGVKYQSPIQIESLDNVSIVQKFEKKPKTAFYSDDSNPPI